MRADIRIVSDNAQMAVLNQKEHYRRQAELCYEIAAKMTGTEAVSMIRLGDAYAALSLIPIHRSFPAYHSSRNLPIHVVRNVAQECD